MKKLSEWYTQDFINSREIVFACMSLSFSLYFIWSRLLISFCSFARRTTGMTAECCLRVLCLLHAGLLRVKLICERFSLPHKLTARDSEGNNTRRRRAREWYPSRLKTWFMMVIPMLMILVIIVFNLVFSCLWCDPHFATRRRTKKEEIS